MKVEPMPRWFHLFPRNSVDYEGGIVLFDVKQRIFYEIEWGCGDNLTHEDQEEGYDDYINWETFHWDHGPIEFIFDLWKKNKGSDFDYYDYLGSMDGGMLLVKRKRKKTGDLREYILDVIEEVSRPDPPWSKPEDLLFVCSI